LEKPTQNLTQTHKANDEELEYKRQELSGVKRSLGRAINGP